MNWSTRGTSMKRMHKIGPLIVVFSVIIVIQAYGTDDCSPCEAANDPSLVAAGASPCIPKTGHGLKCGEPGKVVRAPDVGIPIPDCGTCPDVVVTITLGKCKTSDDPCDTCIESELMKRRRLHIGATMFLRMNYIVAETMPFQNTEGIHYLLGVILPFGMCIIAL